MKSIHTVFIGILSIVLSGMITSRLAGATVESPVSVEVDWPEFVARQDLIWETLPTEFD